LNKRILLLSVDQKPANGRATSYLTEPLEALGYTLDVQPITSRKKWGIIFSALTARVRFKDYDAVISTEYGRVTGAALRKMLTRSTCVVGIVGLNQSGSLVKTGLGILDRRLNRIYDAMDFAIVHSQQERDLWHAIHDISLNRIPFAHWGYDLPVVAKTLSASMTAPYFCMIGRNNRDFQTFCDATEAAGVNGVIIASKYGAPEFRKPDCVRLELDLPLAECLGYLQGAVANVILVNDETRGAGHITAVSGMHLARPAIFTDAATLSDYLIDGYNGLAVPFRDAAQTAKAMKRLVAEPDLCTRLGEAGRAYSEKWLTTAAVGRQHARIIVDAIEGRPLPPVPVDWAAEYAALSGASPERT